MLAWTLDNTIPNIRNPHTMLMVSVDDDDEESKKVAMRYMDRVWISSEPREDSVGAKYNRALKVPADVYLPMVDYVAHVTPGFDEKILEAAALFPDGIGVVYNYLANYSFPGIQAVTQGLVDKLGYIFPEHFPYWFIDHWVDDVAKMIDRISFADVQVAVNNNRSTHEYREPYFWATFFDACGLVRRKQARDIIDGEDFLEPDWRKEVLRRHYPLIESKSQWVNEQVRSAGTGRLNATDGGERYTRIKGNAVSMLQNELVPSLEKNHAQHEVLRAAA